MKILLCFIFVFLFFFAGAEEAAFQATRSERSGKCTDFTYDFCSLETGALLNSIGSESAESCQTICNVVYGGVCKFFHFDRTLSWCSVMVQTVEDHVRNTCNQVSGPREPNVDDCPAEGVPCDSYHEESCSYEGEAIEIINDLDSTSECQKACQNSLQCARFLHNLIDRICLLLDSGNRSCEHFVGPAKPTIEDC